MMNKLKINKEDRFRFNSMNEDKLLKEEKSCEKCLDSELTTNDVREWTEGKNEIRDQPCQLMN